MATPSYFGMSDEEFLKQAIPPEPADEPAVQEPKAAAAEPEVEDTTDDVDAGSAGSGSQSGTDPDDDETTGSETDPSKDVEAKEPETDQVSGEADPLKAKAAATDTTKDTAKDKAPEQVTDKTQEKSGESTAPDYEGFYKRIMAPFKANGKMIELKTPEEALQLMQMGANYTKKMQDIVPHRKTLLMLENNGLLDPDKLSYLIDLDKKNPEAIKKLIKESGIDPMEIDTTAEPNYRAGNHRVTDEEANFRSALDDMRSNQTGMETLQAINTDWDHASKELLWKSPEVLGIIHQQRESGIYDRIVTEMNRQRTLGAIAPTTPFLQAYKTVGDQITAANGFADLVNKGQGQPAPVVTTRAAAPKPAVVNSDKAKAASSTRTSAQTQKAFVNPLAMSDDEFLKQMRNRI